MADLNNIVQIPLDIMEYPLKHPLKYIMIVNPTPEEIDKWSMELPDDIGVESVWVIPIITDKEIAISVDYSNLLKRYHTTKPLYFPWKEKLLLSKEYREAFIAHLFDVKKAQEISFEYLKEINE